MSLGRLLKSGRSLVDLKQPGGAYRMDKNNLLPKFGSAKNPFTRAEKVQLERPEPAVKIETNRTAPVSRAEVETANRKPAIQIPEAPAKPAEAKATDSKPPAPSKKTGNVFGWMRHLNPLRWMPRRKPKATPFASDPARRPVQAELSLDNVKVVRNDLSDADVEIVPGRQQSVAPGADPAPSKPAEPVKSAEPLEEQLVKT